MLPAIHISKKIREFIYTQNNQQSMAKSNLIGNNLCNVQKFKTLRNNAFKNMFAELYFVKNTEKLLNDIESSISLKKVLNNSMKRIVFKIHRL